MARLSRAQTELLTAAAQAAAGAIDAPEDSKETTARLIKRGLMISQPAEEGPDQLLITAAGRDAIGAPPYSPPPPDFADIDAEAAAGRPKAAQDLPSVPATPAEPKGKIGVVVSLLRQPGGASLEALKEATGWQAHSVRGALSGAVKKGLGLEVLSEKIEGVRTYRIDADATEPRA